MSTCPKMYNNYFSSTAPMTHKIQLKAIKIITLIKSVLRSANASFPTLCPVCLSVCTNNESGFVQDFYFKIPKLQVESSFKTMFPDQVTT